jgi:hypothetical protein
MMANRYMMSPIDALVLESDINATADFSDEQDFRKQGLRNVIKIVNLHLAGYANL